MLLLGLGLLNYFGDSDEILIKVDYVTRLIFEGYDLIGKFWVSYVLAGVCKFNLILIGWGWILVLILKILKSVFSEFFKII